MDTAATVVAAALGAHVLLKLLVFLAPYRVRRASLDKAYADRASATAGSDTALLVLVVAALAVLFAAGAAPVSLLVGLWCGATLIQVYFHRFHVPLTEQEAPPTHADSPIKVVSYAIQAAPWRPWREVALLAAAVVVALVLLVA